MFSTHLEDFLLFLSNLKLSSADCSKLDLPKILLSGNWLKYDSFRVREERRELKVHTDRKVREGMMDIQEYPEFQDTKVKLVTRASRD